MSSDGESYGNPVASEPTNLACQGPECDAVIRTYLTDEDAEARETVRVLRYTPESDGERLITYWFCGSECRESFIADDEREETLFDEEDKHE